VNPDRTAAALALLAAAIPAARLQLGGNAHELQEVRDLAAVVCSLSASTAEDAAGNLPPAVGALWDELDAVRLEAEQLQRRLAREPRGGRPRGKT
jgi:hypothetical protein